MFLEKLASQNQILILGFAREGQSTYKFLRARFPHLRFLLADAKTPDWIPEDPFVETVFGDHYLSSLSKTQICIKTPGISPHKPEIVAAKVAGVQFTSHMQIFFEICPSPNTIGITGTKGKSTTASLIYEVIKSGGLPAVLVGNIGKPALDYLPEISENTWVVMELSSYQLMDLTLSPHIAVLQSIYPDHLDYHTDLEEYSLAKSHIFSFQQSTDFFIYNAADPTINSLISNVQKPAAILLPYTISDYPKNLTSHLLGDHNKLNILPSLTIAKLLKIPDEKVRQTISEFTPLSTRLQEVSSVNGVRFFEDTLATIPEATIAGIDALHPNVETLIAGGHERKQNYLELAKKILNSNIKTLIVFPTTGPRIWEQINHLENNPNITYHYSESMSDAVQFALDHTRSGAICLLSPAAPSFTLFRDYRDEGNQYRKSITELLARH